MPERHPPSGWVLAAEADADLDGIMGWTEVNFGSMAADRYDALMLQAFEDIAADPQRPGSSELACARAGVRLYHIRFSKIRARIAHGIVKKPRHFLVYRQRESGEVEIARILHDGRDPSLHLPPGMMQE